MDADKDAERLAVFWDERRVGTLFHTDPLSFAYDPAWLTSAGASVLHQALPLQAGIQDAPGVYVFFENLLPEGDQRRLASMRYKVSSVFGLLRVAGGDTAGAVVLLPEGTLPSAPVYQRLTWEEVDALLHADARNVKLRERIQADAQRFPAPRVSISGAQLKMLLSLDEQGKPMRPMGSTPSTHILKPDIVRSDINVFASAANETLVMMAARLCDLPVAAVAYQSVVKACLVERNDRTLRADGTLERHWQADFCQMLGMPSDVKYEADGGPSFADCFALVKRESVRPGVDQRLLLRWLFFNLYVGNNDSHAKNLSMLATPGGLRLAPFYDLMSTRVYPGLGEAFAFAIDGQTQPGQIGASHLQSLAGTLGITPRYLMTIARDMAVRVETAIPAAAQALADQLSHSEMALVDRLVKKVSRLVRQMRKRLAPRG
ncbi:type II toxin-antitoxin system HipA family toxin [Bordetella ansorpii]|nr:type II toxin-antitoxin system HipA family toxin [Bordetella ansorpii]